VAGLTSQRPTPASSCAFVPSQSGQQQTNSGGAKKLDEQKTKPTRPRVKKSLADPEKMMTWHILCTERVQFYESGEIL
jgi:hypothetical protein